VLHRIEGSGGNQSFAIIVAGLSIGNASSAFDAFKPTQEQADVLR